MLAGHVVLCGLPLRLWWWRGFSAALLLLVELRSRPRSPGWHRRLRAKRAWARRSISCRRSGKHPARCSRVVKRALGLLWGHHSRPGCTTKDGLGARGHPKARRRADQEGETTKRTPRRRRDSSNPTIWAPLLCSHRHHRLLHQRHSSCRSSWP